MVWLIASLCSMTLWITVLCSHIRIRIQYSRVEGNDSLKYDVKAFLGLLRYRLEVPVIQLKGPREGVYLKSEMIYRNFNKDFADYKENVTYRKAIRFMKKMRKLLQHVSGFKEWLNGTMSNFKCVTFAWSTRIGLGEAPETAVCTGILWSAKGALLSQMSSRVQMKAIPSIQVAPVFNGKHLSTDLTVEMKIRHAHALQAKIMLLIRILKVKGGLRLWGSALRDVYRSWKDRRRKRSGPRRPDTQTSPA